MRATAVSSATGGRVGTAVLILSLMLGLGPSARLAAEPAGKFMVFGHLTQAYGESSRGTIQSTTKGGTTDAGNIAVQFRWEISEKETAVVQLSHERRANDIFSPNQNELEIDWAFYERRIAENTTLKAGRLNAPLGIYNEVRDVGTLLPFFNLPISFYTGVLSSAETVDGISLSHLFAARSDWDLEVDLYYGGWDTAQQQVQADAEFGLVNFEARAEEGFGIQLWLNTPIRGLRLGAGGLTWLLDGPLTQPGTKDRWDSFHLSLDLSADPWIVRSEYRRWHFDQDFGAFLHLPDPLPARAEREGFYAQVGYWATDQIGLFGQFEKAELENSLGLLPEANDFHEDTALSFTYRFRPDLVVRAEYHWADTRFPIGEFEGSLSGSGEGAGKINWLIVALSASF